MTRTRKIRGLIGSWVAYWAVLAAVKLGPAAVAIWRATHAGEGQGSFAINFGNGAFTLTVTERGQQIYTGTASLVAIALWIAGPPLLAWIVWAVSRRNADHVSPREER